MTFSADFPTGLFIDGKWGIREYLETTYVATEW